jgi:3-oxoacyl-[acyl-carrier-protein] synthase-3
VTIERTRRSVIAGTGSALPNRRVTNNELAQTVDTTHEWIIERTGIEARHIAGDGETTATLATLAAREALAAAGVDAGQVGLIVLATATPDQTFPSSATRVQTALGIDDCIAFDISAVCTGFLYALSVADNMIKGGMTQYALVIGSETFSRILDWEDRTTCVLFGDGAGAVLLKAEMTTTRAFWRPGSTPTVATTTCCMSMAACRPPARSASCGCAARKCSATRSPIWPRS